jgi:hypothetical protein
MSYFYFLKGKRMNKQLKNRAKEMVAYIVKTAVERSVDVVVTCRHSRELHLQQSPQFGYESYLQMVAWVYRQLEKHGINYQIVDYDEEAFAIWVANSGERQIDEHDAQRRQKWAQFCWERIESLSERLDEYLEPQRVGQKTVGVFRTNKLVAEELAAGMSEQYLRQFLKECQSILELACAESGIATSYFDPTSPELN